MSYTVIITVFVVGLGYVFFSVFAYVGLSFSPDSSDASSKNASANESLELQSFERIQGTPYLLANVVKETDSYYNSRASGSSEVRNLIFLETKTLSSSRLFEVNENIILNLSKYPKQQTVSQDENITIQWLVYQIVKEDTNEDGSKDRRDVQTIAVSSVNGSNYTELLDHIDRLNTITMIEDGKLLVVYTEGDINKVSVFDLVNLGDIRTEEIIELGKVGE